MRRVKDQGSRVKGVRLATFILLFTVYFSLFTVITGCGKKAPPKLPKETALVR